jgi:hypothetical protein
MGDDIDAVAASELATAAILGALVERLTLKGLMIEEGQGASPEAELIFAAARELIEQHLRRGPASE